VSTERDHDRRGDVPDYQGEVPTSHHPTREAETIGDPHADDPEAASQEGAAAGAIVGTAVAGPVGLAVGAVAGAMAGAAGESADATEDPEARAHAGDPASFEPERPGQQED